MLVFVPLLYLPAMILIWLSWRHRAGDPVLPDWRRALIVASVFGAAVALLVDLVYSVSWLHSGGNPHGIEQAKDGIWRLLRPALKWVYGSALLLSFFGKGRQRIYLLASVVTVFFAGGLVYILQMD